MFRGFCVSLLFWFVHPLFSFLLGRKKGKWQEVFSWQSYLILSYLILSYFLLSDAANIINIISYLMAPSYNPRDNKKKTEKERQLGKHY